MKIMQTTLKKIYAAQLLLILLSAYVGQKVHIYTEDLQNFAAFSGDLVPDNGATSAVTAHCPVCDYEFFKYLEKAEIPHVFYAALIAVVQPEATRCKCGVTERLLPTRAPPAA